MKGEFQDETHPSPPDFLARVSNALVAALFLLRVEMRCKPALHQQQEGSRLAITLQPATLAAPRDL